MAWDLFSYQEELEKAKIKPILYNNKQYREYIKKNFNPDYYNSKFYNILITSYFSNDDSWCESSVTPEEQLIYFKQLYSGFSYHFQNDKISIFSLKHKYNNADDEYSLFIHIFGDFIVELPNVKDLFKEEQCMPACAINWYNEDGTWADISKVLNLSEEEKTQWLDYLENGNEIINPKDSNQFCYSEYRRDRREYYFFYKMGLHNFGKFGRVFDKHKRDWFSDYTFTLMDLYNYYHKMGGSIE